MLGWGLVAETGRAGVNSAIYKSSGALSFGNFRSDDLEEAFL